MQCVYAIHGLSFGSVLLPGLSVTEHVFISAQTAEGCFLNSRGRSNDQMHRCRAHHEGFVDWLTEEGQGDGTVQAAQGLQGVTPEVRFGKELGPESGREPGQGLRNCLVLIETSGCFLQGGQMQTSRARTTVVPLPVAPAPARTLKMSAASKASSGTFLPSDSEEEYPSQT